MGSPRFYITDVFTTRKYGGNPLATFIDCEEFSDHEMQAIAKEINFSETTFIGSRTPREGGFDVRIFTPVREVEFAGHPALGTAFVIREKLRLTNTDDILLNLRIGQIPVRFESRVNGINRLWMRQMAPTFGQTREIETLSRVLNLAPEDIDIHSPIEEVSTGFPTLVVPLANLHALQRARIHADAYEALVQDAWAKLILAYCREGHADDHQIAVRVFADFYGIIEDAATGSANGALAAYLLKYRVFGAGNLDVQAGQGYQMGRPSQLFLRAEETLNSMQINVGGSVVSVAEGVWG